MNVYLPFAEEHKVELQMWNLNRQKKLLNIR